MARLDLKQVNPHQRGKSDKRGKPDRRDELQASSQQVVTYRPRLLYASFIGWSFVLPFILVSCFVSFLIAPFAFALFALSPDIIDSLPYFSLLVVVYSVILSVAALALGLTAVTGDDQIYITSSGVTFPLHLSIPLRFRRARHWQEISHVTYLPSAEVQEKPHNSVGKEQDNRLGKKQELSGKLAIFFRTGEHVQLDANAFNRGEFEKFLLALEVLGDSVRVEDDVKQLRQSLRAENEELGELSFTQVWERELESRFHATVFVPLEPGTTLQNGRLKVIRQLAFGGLSAIYLVQQSGKELLILKEAVIPPGAKADTKTKAMELFQREARLLIGLDHDRIVKVYDHFMENDRNYLLLGRIIGQNLRQYVDQNGPQDLEIVMRWFQDIVEILNYLHDREPAIIHRDITPENLILRDDGRICLIDFGVANEFLGTVTGTVVGKQAYMSPEQFRGKPSKSSDFYSLAGTLHFLVTGKDPLAMTECKPREVNPAVSESFNELVLSFTRQEESKRCKPPSREDPGVLPGLPTLTHRLGKGSQ